MIKSYRSPERELMWGMLEAFSYFFFYFQTFAYPSEFLNEKWDFPLKISPEIIVCHVEAVRQPTGAFHRPK